MKTFGEFLIEDHDELKKKLDALPSVPKDQRWLHKSQTEKYSDSEDEIHTKHVAKMATNETHGHWRTDHRSEPKYSKTELRKIPLDKVHYSQPSLNKGKLLHFAKHYHPEKGDFHPRDGVLSKHEAPHAFHYPDGTYVSSDHHRLIASHLRGDTHAWARVHTKVSGPNGLRYVKTKKEKE